MQDHNLAADIASEAAKGVPPVAVTTTAILGMIDWQTWVLFLTCIYVMMQIGWLAWRYVDKWRGKKVSDDG